MSLAPGPPGTQPHVFGEEGTYTVRVTVKDDSQGDSASASFQVEVFDPVVVASHVAISAVEGEAFTSKPVATFSDPGGPEPNPSDPGGTVKNHYAVVSINWGDGSPLDITSGAISESAGSFTVGGSHTYSEEGIYTVTTTINHEGVISIVTSTASVADPAVIPVGAALTPVEGKAFTSAVATFMDPGGPETVGNYSASIDWGDGTAASAGVISRSGTTYTVVGTHSYAEESALSRPGSDPYHIKVTVHHEGALDAEASSTATVLDALLAAVGDFNVNSIEGKTFTAVVATFTDSNSSAPLNDFTATISWGDGHSSDGIITRTAAGEFTVRGTHSYGEAGEYDVLVHIKDQGGSKATASSDADISDESDLAMIAALATANITKKSTPWLAA
jgi:hypothetical protein